MTFRRRPGARRRLRPGLTPGRPRVPPVVRQALMRAHRAMGEGAYGEAARIYGRLADEAKKRGRIKPGVQMDLEATRAHLADQDYAGAQARALHALRWLLEAGHLPARVRVVVAQVTESMHAQGAEEAAGAFEARVRDLLAEFGHRWADVPEVVDAASGVSPDEGRRLPPNCPACYAPLRPDEVEWAAPGRAQCTYCGSIVLAS